MCRALALMRTRLQAKLTVQTVTDVDLKDLIQSNKKHFTVSWLSQGVQF
jgi:hypothetical protein